MTKQGQWVVFSPSEGFAYQPQSKRMVKFDNTPTGWDLTVELEAPNEANKRIEEYAQVQQADRNVEQEGRTPSGTPDFICKMIAGNAHPFGRPGNP